MAGITVGTTVLEASAATKTGQIVVTKPFDAKSVYKGHGVITMDGTATTATIPFIDGTQALAYTPSVILVSSNLVSGTGGVALGITVNTITDTGFAVKLSAAGTSADVYNIPFIALK